MATATTIFAVCLLVIDERARADHAARKRARLGSEEELCDRPGVAKRMVALEGFDTEGPHPLGEADGFFEAIGKERWQQQVEIDVAPGRDEIELA